MDHILLGLNQQLVFQIKPFNRSASILNVNIELKCVTGDISDAMTRMMQEEAMRRAHANPISPNLDQQTVRIGPGAQQ